MNRYGIVLQGKLTARIWIHPIAKVHIYFLSTQLFAHFPVICMGVQSSLTILVAPTFPSYQKLVGTTRCSASLFFHPFFITKNCFFLIPSLNWSKGKCYCISEFTHFHQLCRVFTIWTAKVTVTFLSNKMCNQVMKMIL